MLKKIERTLYFHKIRIYARKSWLNYIVQSNFTKFNEFYRNSQAIYGIIQ